MASAAPSQAVKARHGEKMIEVRIRFWTDDIAGLKDHVLPKHAWSSGVVVMDRNQAHAISPKDPRPFNSVLQLPAVIEKTLVDHGIKLHTSRTERRYRD
jgi:hypothetical protein